MKRYFSIEEANRQLPLIEPFLLILQNLKREINLKHRRLQLAKEAVGATSDQHSFFADEAEIEFLMMQANYCIERISDYGAELKDVDSGLIDFYTIVEGEEAFLCWKLGEGEIHFWHGLHDGYAGRKSISMLYEDAD
jgi:hypothetical protein